MTNDLIERYIYAVTKRLPNKTKNDVSEELRTLIDDMLTERCGDVTPGEKDIKVVLTELGTPNELYEKYNPDEKKCLIGAPYYLTYKYVLKIVFICVIFGIVIATVIAGILDGTQNPMNMDATSAQAFAHIFADIITNLIINLLGGLVFAFAFVTILFAFFEYKKVNIDTSDNLDSLPSVPQKNQKISVCDPIVGIAISVAFWAVFLIAPQIFCAITSTEVIPIFNVETIRATWYLIAIFSACGIVREIVKLIERRYNKKVMITTIVADIISAIIAVIWLSNSKIINPDFTRSIHELFEDSGEFIINVMANFQYFFLGVILFALLLDAFDTIVKTLKGKAE